MSLTDETSIAAFASGDPTAIRQVVEAWTPAMLRLARVHVDSQVVAEDVVQDSWAVVLRGLDRFEGRSSLRSYVLGVVVNTAKRTGAKERRTVPFSSAWRSERDDDSAPAVPPERFAGDGGWLNPPSAWASRPEELLSAAEVRGQIVLAIERLPGRLVLAAAPPQCRLGQRDQGGWVKRPLDHRDVTEQLEVAGGGGVALQTTTPFGQEDERKVGPLRLRLQERADRLQVARAERLVGDDREAGAGIEAIDQIFQTAADRAGQSGLGEHRLRQQRVAPPRREDQTMFGCRGRQVPASSRTFAVPTSVGIPLSTPWKFLRGSPKVTPLPLMRYSRIESS